MTGGEIKICVNWIVCVGLGQVGVACSSNDLGFEWVKGERVQEGVF